MTTLIPQPTLTTLDTLTPTPTTTTTTQAIAIAIHTPTIHTTTPTMIIQATTTTATLMGTTTTTTESTTTAMQPAHAIAVPNHKPSWIGLELSGLGSLPSSSDTELLQIENKFNRITYYYY